MASLGNEPRTSPRRFKMSRKSFLSGVGHLAVAGSAVALGTSAFALSSCSGASALREAVVGDNMASLRVGIDFSRPPFESLTSAGREGSVPVSDADLCGTGFNVSLVERLSDSIGRAMYLVNVDCGDLPDCLKKGYVDVVASSYLNGSKDADLAFSQPYRSYDLAVVCRNDSPLAQADSLADLAGARMGARSGSDLEEAIKAIPGVYVAESLGPDASAVTQVREGALDATLVEREAFLAVLSELPDLTVAPVSAKELATLAPTGLALGVRTQDVQLLQKLNLALSAIDDVELDEMWSNAVASWKASQTLVV